MSRIDDDLRDELEALRTEGLFRQLRCVDSPQSPRLNIDGRSFLNFSSNDYLGLANHPTLKEAAIKAIERYGAGAGASRLISGSLAPHHELEESIAAFKGTEAALSFSSGYAAATGAITALVGKEDILILDKLVHASLVDAARLSRAKLRVYAHNSLDDLEKKLKWAQSISQAAAGRRPRILIVTESLFSMDGDIAPLRNVVDLKDKYGAWLMVDEAHATGLYGENRRGLAEEFGVSARIEIQMGTLGKALGSAGGYIAGSRQLIELLINRARSFIFSTAPVPAAAAAATAAIGLLRSHGGEVLRQRLWGVVEQIKRELLEAGFQLPPVRSAIIPLILGQEKNALAAAEI
ncbi:MAG: 8-amino-7-oxononanoate synthase, partial [Pedosphaera sp.]|nr:8-amino-7-oxononanoate synthase [Pedosphaera sp.]